MKKLILYLLSVLTISLATSCNLLQEIIDHDDSNTDKNFEGLESNYYILENFADSLDAIYNDLGYIYFCADESVYKGIDESITERIKSIKGNTFFCAKVDIEAGEIDESSIAMTIFDSTDFPVYMSTESLSIYLSKCETGMYDCSVYDSKNGTWTHHKDVGLISDIETRCYTKSLATGGHVDLDRLISLANISKGAWDIKKAKKLIDKLPPAFDILAETPLVSEETALFVGIKYATSLSNAVATLITYLGLKGYDKFDDFAVEQLGNVKLSIDNFRRLDGRSCEISYSISGLNDNGLNASEILMCVYSPNGYYNFDVLPSKNATGSRVWTGMSSGRYTVELTISSTKYGFINYTAMYSFSMFDLNISNCVVETEPKYSDGKVNFHLDIQIEGDKTGFDEWSKLGFRFGYYIKYANVIDYKEVKNISSIFESTPLTYELPIPRDGFSDETINYTAFEATPSIDYYIGLYTEIDGKLMTYDEQKLELVYSEHPEVETREYVSVSPTTVNVKGEFENCLFWNAIRGVEYVAESESNPKSLVLGANMEDGEHQFPLEDLKPNTTYQYRAFYEVNGIREYGEPMEFKTEPLNLTLDSIFYNDDYYYYTKDNNGYVAYNLTAKISGNADDIGECQSCGIYIWNSEKNESYIWHEGLSGAYNNTPIKMSIGVGESAFDKRDDLRYYAECAKYYFGVYVQFNDGSYYMSEPVQCKFVYDRKPSYRFTSVGSVLVSVAGSKENEDGETVIEYNAKHAYSYFYEGAFWIDYIQWWCDGSWYFTNTGEKYDEPSTLTGDMVNAYDATRSLHYWSNTDMYHSVWCVITTKIGETLYSNPLLYGGTPENPTVSIGGTRSYSSMSNARLLIDNNVGSGKGGSINFLPENRTLKKCDIIEIEDLEILYE